MGNDVFANGREVSCKAADGKSICAFPDVCFTPPENPATPPGVPIPYPNTGMAKDTTSGSKKVKVSGKEVMLKNKSYFKKSTGDEAGSAAKKGVITSTNRGKVYFNSWSMDVKFEGENVVRHLDLTTHNHMSVPGNSPTWPYLDNMSMAKKREACGDEMDAVAANCPNANKMGKTHKDCPKYGKTKQSNKNFGDNKCVKAKRCMLVPKERAKSHGGCCKGQTGHHLLPKHHFVDYSNYIKEDAPCVCAEGHSWHRNDDSNFPDSEKTHPKMHDFQDAVERDMIEQVEEEIAKGADTNRTPDKAMYYDEARESAIAAHNNNFTDPKCSEKCLRSQLDAYHKQAGVRDNHRVKTKKTGAEEQPDNIDEIFDAQSVQMESFLGN